MSLIHADGLVCTHKGYEVGRAVDIPSAEPEIIRCRECKHYHENVWSGQLGYPNVPLILGHEMCDFWGDGCKTKEDGYCFAAERRNDE